MHITVASQCALTLAAGAAALTPIGVNAFAVDLPMRLLSIRCGTAHGDSTWEQVGRLISRIGSGDGSRSGPAVHLQNVRERLRAVSHRTPRLHLHP